MKVTKLLIKNIGLIEDAEIVIDKPLILFYGEIQQGKTTYLNAVRWVCGGSFPSDIIRHGQEEAAIELHFEGGLISRAWYVAKDKTTKAREVVFFRNGRPVSSPVSEIRRLLNPFLLNQDYLRQMGEAERKAYFTEMFAVDTSALDNEYFNLDRQASNLRAKIKGYGHIDVTPPTVTDPGPLRIQFAQLRAEHTAAVNKVNEENAQANDRNSNIARGREKVSDLNEEIAALEKQIEDKKAKRDEVARWLDHHPEIKVMPQPPAPDTAELEQKIEEAVRSQEKAQQYRDNLDRQTQKNADEAELGLYEFRMKEIKAAKLAKLKEISDKIPIQDLRFDENGQFVYQGCQAGMLSTSQIMQLSSELSELYPKGLGLELLDRGESLGKSIFEFIERAQKEEKSILATIVGEAPAEVPEKVGVFVVEKGKAKPKAKAKTPKQQGNQPELTQ